MDGSVTASFIEVYCEIPCLNYCCVDQIITLHCMWSYYINLNLIQRTEVLYFNLNYLFIYITTPTASEMRFLRQKTFIYTKSLSAIHVMPFLCSLFLKLFISLNEIKEHINAAKQHPVEEKSKAKHLT